jgi:type II secretory pathway predicted ATPase ExeA
MYQQHFGLTAAPLGKHQPELFDDGQLGVFEQRFNWLLESPGIGLLTGVSGIGKTAALRRVTQALNPHRYRVVYTAETDFGRLDLYRNLALALDLEPAFRRAALWRQLKARISDLHDSQNLLPVWLIDEAQNLPREFFRDLPAFLNFAFDSEDKLTVWLIGHPTLAATLRTASFQALASRLRVSVSLQPPQDPEHFAAMLDQALKACGCHQTLMADTGVRILYHASAAKPRQAGQVLQTALQLAAEQGLNHLPDHLIEQAVEVHR